MAKNNYGQRLIPEPDLKYLEKVIETYPDPTDIGGGGGTSYSAGDGIIIANNTISVDQEDVAMVANLANVAFSGSYNDLSNTPAIDETVEVTFTSNPHIVTLTNEQYAKIKVGTKVIVHTRHSASYSFDQAYIITYSNDYSFTGYLTENSMYYNGYFSLVGPIIDIDKSTKELSETSSSYGDIFRVGTGLTVNDSGMTPILSVDTSVLPVGDETIELTFTSSTHTATLTNEQYAKVKLGTKVIIHNREPNTYHHDTVYIITYESDNSGSFNAYGALNVPTYKSDTQNFTIVSGTLVIDKSTKVLTESMLSRGKLFGVGTGLTVDSNWDLNVDPSIIPAAVSGTNDGTNWTSLTIGNDTYSIGSSTPSNMVTTNTTQAITGTKTFINSNGIQSRSSWTSTNRAILNGYSTTPYLELQTGNGYSDNLMVSSHQISYTPANGSSNTDFKIIAHYPEDSNKAFTYIFKAPLYTDTAKTYTVATTDDIPTVPTLYRHEVALDSVVAHDKIWLTIFNYDPTPFTLDTLWTYLIGLGTNTVNRISASGRWVDDQASSNNVYWITDIFDSGASSLTCGCWNTADGSSKNHGISTSNRSIKDKVITIS